MTAQIGDDGLPILGDVELYGMIARREITIERQRIALAAADDYIGRLLSQIRELEGTDVPVELPPSGTRVEDLTPEQLLSLGGVPPKLDELAARIVERT